MDLFRLKFFIVFVLYSDSTNGKLIFMVYLTRVKNAVRMRAFPSSGANLHVPPPIEIIRDTKTN